MDFEMQACYEMGVCEQTYVILQQTQFKMKTCTYNDGFLDSCMLRLALNIIVKDSINYLAQINNFEMKVLSFNELNVYIFIFCSCYFLLTLCSQISQLSLWLTGWLLVPFQMWPPSLRPRQTVCIWNLDWITGCTAQISVCC